MCSGLSCYSSNYARTEMLRLADAAFPPFLARARAGAFLLTTSSESMSVASTCTFCKIDTIPGTTMLYEVGKAEGICIELACLCNVSNRMS